jgi:hypothetical protein
MEAKIQRINAGNSKTTVSTILMAGFFAGSLDLVAAILFYFIKGGKDPLRVFQYIASAVFGQKAFSGGWEMGVLGILFHFIIAFSFTVLFFFLYKRWSALTKNIVFTAVFYGVAIWIIMNLVVLRITKLTLKQFVVAEVLSGISILIVAIGLPLTLIARKYYSKKNII